MNESFSDELMSAYLDGELTPDEQAGVEQALVESAECRQVFEELQALRGDLQALPRHRLPADFSQRVIRRAEQALLREAESIVAATNKQPAEPVDLPGPEQPAAVAEGPLHARQWSGVVWAFAAVAAALLLALYLPGIEPGSVAIKDDKPIKIRRVQSETITQRGVVVPSENVADAFREGELPGPRQLTDGVAKGGVPEDGKVPGFAGSPGGEPAKTPPLETSLPKEPVPLPGVGGDLSKNAKKQIDSPEGPAAISPAPAAPPLLATPPVVADDVKAQADVAGAKPVAGRGPTPAAEEASPDKEAAEPPLFVVRLPATRAALEAGDFDAVLRKHKIRVEDKIAEAVLAEGVDVLYVEASVAQVDAVLADLRAQPDRFLGVAGRRLADDEAAATFQYGNASREKLLAPRDRRSNGVEGLDKSFHLSRPDAESAKKSESSEAKLAKPNAGKPGESKADALGGGVSGGAPARSFAPGAPGGAPAPGQRADKRPAELPRGAAGKTKEEAQSDGLASRITEGSFKYYSRFEQRDAEDELSREGDAKKRNEIRLNLMKLADAYEGRGEKEAYFRSLSSKQDMAEVKRLLAKDTSEQAKELKERLDRVDGAERIRVVFVIRAVEQEPAARPEK